MNIYEQAHELSETLEQALTMIEALRRYIPASDPLNLLKESNETARMIYEVQRRFKEQAYDGK